MTQRIANPCTPVRFRYSPPYEKSLNSFNNTEILSCWAFLSFFVITNIINYVITKNSHKFYLYQPINVMVESNR